MAAVPTYKLNSGQEMPMIGLGTWQSKAGEVYEAVKAAIAAGYRHIDTAYIYGNEAEIGKALTEVLAEGKVKREELFIVTKLWNTCHKTEDVKPALEESLRLLGLDYLDLYLVHWAISLQSGEEKFPRDADGNLLYADIDPLDTWRGMEACVDAGLTRAIGLSNSNSQQVQQLLDHGRIKPANLQVEIHPYFSNARLVDYCLERGVSVTAYSPLGAPKRPWAPSNEPSLLEAATIKEIAASHNRSSAQVILRWLLQRNIIVIPKSVTPSRIVENFTLCDFELSAEEMKTMNDFNSDERLVVPSIDVDGKRVFRDAKAPHFPFNIPF